MEKIIRLICFILILQSCNDANKLIKEKAWFRLSDGEIFEIRGDSLYITKYFWENSKAYKYEIRDNYIFVQDSLYGFIDSISNNCLITYIDSSLSNLGKKFHIPIDDFHSNIEKSELMQLLSTKSWKITQDRFNYRFDFTKDIEGASDFYKVYVSEWNDSINEVADVRLWNIKEYGDQLLLIISDWNFWHMQCFQIKEGYENEILANMYYYGLFSMKEKEVSVTFERIEPISSTDSIINKLTKGRWVLDDYEILAINKELNFGEQSKFEPREKEMPLPRIQRQIYSMKRIYNQFYLSKTISYEFTEDLYGFLIVENDTVRRGEWSISNDGKYIITDPYSFFYSSKIIEISDSSLILDKAVVVDFQEDKSYEKWHIREKLKQE